MTQRPGQILAGALSYLPATPRLALLPASVVLSRYETVANLQPGGTRQVLRAESKNSHETREFQLNNFELVNSGVAHGHPNRNRMLTNMDGTSATTIDQATLDEIVRRILSVTSPEKIILFGSAATGTMTVDSDIDLLVIEQDIPDRRQEYVRIRRALRDIAFPFDIILTTNDYFESTKDVIGGIAYPVNKEGRVLYAAA